MFKLNIMSKALKLIVSQIRNNTTQIKLHYKKPLFELSHTISKPSEAVELVKHFADTETFELKEHSWIILFSKTNKVHGISEISIGGFNRVSTNFREILQIALLSNAGKIIFLHNHTSESAKPSDADIEKTEELRTLLDLVNINLMDHIILNNNSFYSFSGDNQL